jgi:hypothetical protein
VRARHVEFAKLPVTPGIAGFEFGAEMLPLIEKLSACFRERLHRVVVEDFCAVKSVASLIRFVREAPEERGDRELGMGLKRANCG